MFLSFFIGIGKKVCDLIHVSGGGAVSVSGCDGILTLDKKFFSKNGLFSGGAFPFLSVNLNLRYTPLLKFDGSRNNES